MAPQGVQGPTMGSWGGAAGDSAWGCGGGMEETLESLVAKVKELSRQGAKEQWCIFTDEHGQGTRDPNRHDAEFLRSFIQIVQTGAPMPASAETNATLGDAIKKMQKQSTNFKSIWAHFCTQYVGGKMDPAKHDATVHAKFLDLIAGLAIGNSGSSLTPTMGPSESPAKRMRDSSGIGIGTSFGGGGGGGFVGGHGGAGACGGASGGSAKEALVSQVKNYQRLGTEQKELWSAYADTYLGGVRDPARHDAATLGEFCANHDVPNVGVGGCCGGGGCSGMSMGMSMGMSIGGGGCCGGGCGNAIWSPSALGGSRGIAMDPAKEGLVVKVKAFQKDSRENAAIWSAFSGTTKDPGRHDATALQEFCQLNGI